MNRLLQRVLLAVAVAWFLFTLLLAKSFQVQGIAILNSRILLGSLLLTAFFLVAGFKLGKEWKFRIVLLLFLLGLLEAVLQLAGLCGVLPGVNTKIHLPYGRVYWTMEGHGNGIRNRYGWNYPAFDLNAPHRIAAIGDSFVEAVEVSKRRNHAYLLQERLNEASPGWSVLALGTHGTSPAHHMDVIEYAAQHFHPEEAILYVYIGNDITETSPALDPAPPAAYLYYNLDDAGHLTPNPDSAGYRSRFTNALALSHESLLYFAPMVAYSHCMTLQTALSIRNGFLQRKWLTQKIASWGAATNNPVFFQCQSIGVNPEPFATNRTSAVASAMLVLEAELARCKEICESHNMRMRIVIIPYFPRIFYDTQKGANWTMQIREYDFLAPGRELAAYAAGRGIPVLDLGDLLQSRKTPVEDIRALFLTDGVGHFTEQGHRFCADAVFDAFYKKKQT